MILILTIHFPYALLVSYHVVMVGRARLMVGMCGATIVSLLGSAAYSSTLPRLAEAWHLDATRAGWIGSAYFAGYAIACAALIRLSAVMRTRHLYLAGSALCVAGGSGFALFARGPSSGILFQAITGAGLAGVYMPGLRLLTERLSPQRAVSVTPYYTAAFGAGSSLDYLVSGWSAARFGWRAPFLLGAAGSLCAAGLMLVATRRTPVLADVTPAANGSDRLPLRTILAYAGHAWEVGAVRTWFPTYLLFVIARHGHARASSSLWAMTIAAVGIPASLVGAEVARRRPGMAMVTWYAAAAVVTSLFIAVVGTWSFSAAVCMLCLYSIAVNADSGALTALLVATSPGRRQGATLAMYSCVGFVGAALGPLATGAVLDLAGGYSRSSAWALAFPVMGAGSALAATAIGRHHAH
jgi:MFS family permease